MGERPRGHICGKDTARSPNSYEGEKMLDKDRDCMKALLIPEARMIFVSLGTGGAPTYRIETLEAGPAMSGEFL